MPTTFSFTNHPHIYFSLASQNKPFADRKHCPTPQVFPLLQHLLYYYSVQSAVQPEGP